MEEKLFTVNEQGKSISDLMSDIHENHNARQQSINQILAKVMMSIEDVSDLPMIMPTVERLVGHQIKNDSHILKLTEIATKIVGVKDDGGDMDSILDELSLEMDSMRNEQNVK